jgi:hypothetical protein
MEFDEQPRLAATIIREAASPLSFIVRLAGVRGLDGPANFAEGHPLDSAMARLSPQRHRPLAHARSATSGAACSVMRETAIHSVTLDAIGRDGQSLSNSSGQKARSATSSKMYTRDMPTRMNLRASVTASAGLS